MVKKRNPRSVLKGKLPSLLTLLSRHSQRLTNAFRNGVPLSIVAKKIPKKIITPADPDELEVGRRKRRWKHR